MENYTDTSKFSNWTTVDAENLYRISQWSAGYFSIGSNGHLHVQPRGEDGPKVDIKQITEGLRERGLKTPILMRFSDILKDRLARIAAAFETARTELKYQGNYHAIYPIKVNQQQHIVEEVQQFGKAHDFGLEAGSKPELMAVLAMVIDDDTPIVCNGFKDPSFIEAVILAGKLGRNIIPIVEKPSELNLILHYAKLHDVRPNIGVRVKLSAKGAGRWETSSGSRSKFGLFTNQVLDVCDKLAQENMLDCFKLLHCHVGSQINDIASIKLAIHELARVYTDLKKQGAGLEYIDVGGGLGVDYDGSNSPSKDGTSINYSLQEYANDVVYYIRQVVNDADIPHPHILSESGRAMVAHHSLMVINVLGWTNLQANTIPANIESLQNNDGLDTPLRLLVDTYFNRDCQPYRESYHDAVIGRDQMVSLFNLGYASLKDRALAEQLFYAICAHARLLALKAEDKSQELNELNQHLSEIYFCNASIFQSLPDAWAIGQAFPIMPIHRLDKAPTYHGILADITCDSDGKIDNFIADGRLSKTLALHDYVPGEFYDIGVFLVGAYQETLGGLHNLFGDTNAVHITIADDNTWMVEEVVESDTIREVLSYVQYEPEQLRRNFFKSVERATHQNRITVQEARTLKDFYTRELASGTYLDSLDFAD